MWALLRVMMFGSGVLGLGPVSLPRCIRVGRWRGVGGGVSTEAEAAAADEAQRARTI